MRAVWAADQVRTVMRAGRFDVLASSTMYASTEPCTMCCAIIYRSGCPRVIYAIKSDGTYGKPLEPARPSQRARLCLGNIHDTMATGNKHETQAVYAGDALQQCALDVVRSYEPVSYHDRP